MNIAILSGKGGTGKTFVAVNLATVAGKSVYIDCDVEEPNGRLFFKPVDNKQSLVTTLIPEFDNTKCTGCRKCVDFCRFNALALIKNKPMVFKEVCHSCGGCSLVCPDNAITEIEKPVGFVEYGYSENVYVVTGCLNLGEPSGIPIIKEALNHASKNNNLTIIDCPPGSACSVMESVESADYCILVVEPTAFGLHNFKMVYELVVLLNKPFGIIINKADEKYDAVEEFCNTNNIPILCRIPYSQKIALLSSKGEIASLHDIETAKLFQNLLSSINKEVLK
ncbi:MAG: 4Fe-4S binding protein [Christensenellaceae bacterium]|nr:4Fe-4S binding protein [Christensenellaceae bacterium]